MKDVTQSQDSIAFSRNDYKILIELYNSDCFTEINALPIKSIQNKVELSENKVRQALKTFMKIGYIDEGATIQRAKTYYVTKIGIEKIKQIIR